MWRGNAHDLEKGNRAMSFVVFLLLFVVLCGWLDARIHAKQPTKGAQ